MFKIIALWLLLLVSFAFPPLLLISIPLVAWYTRRMYRRVQFLRRSRDYYLEEEQILRSAKWLR